MEAAFTLTLWTVVLIITIFGVWGLLKLWNWARKDSEKDHDL